MAGGRQIPGWLRTGILGLSVPAMLLCLCAPTDPWWWPGELASHWGGHAAFLLLPAIALWAKRPVVSGSLLVLVVLGCARPLAAVWQPRAPVPAPDAAPFRVVSANLYVGTAPGRRAAALAAIFAQDPDLVCLVEANPDLDQPRIDPVRWPYQAWISQDGGAGRNSLALVSRHPLVDRQTLNPQGLPQLLVTVGVPGHPLRVIAVHTNSPISPAFTRERNADLALIADTARQAATTGPVLVLGDCNLSPANSRWDVLADAGLRRPLAEPATWHALLGPCGIAIDHVLGVGVAIAPPAPLALPGSDHRGLVTRVAW